MVVNVPAPTISGKTSGTMDAVPDGLSFLKIGIPKIISTASTNITREPATAKEEISTLNRLSNPSPTNRKATRRIYEAKAAFMALILCPLFCMSLTIGTAPVMSITANKTMKALASS